MRAIPSRSRLVAATRRKSLSTSCTSPTGRKRRSSRARRNAPCMTRGRSPTSSRKSVPLCAASKSPSRARSAPVKAPRLWPKRWLSTRVSGREAQSTVTKGWAARPLLRNRALANSSLPTPVSPRISTLTSLWAAWASSLRAWAMPGPEPRMCPLSTLREAGPGLRPWRNARMCRRHCSMSRICKGLVRNSQAPERRAASAASPSPWPVMITMSGSSDRLANSL